MKTLIIGAGVIGTLYGWALSKAGHDVTHYVRPGKAQALAAGIPIDILDERKGHPRKSTGTYRVKCVEAIAPADGYELIIVSVNPFKLDEVLQAVAPRSGDALFLMFCSNWDGTERVDRYLPADRYLFGYPDGGGTYKGRLLWGNLGAEVHLGEVGGQKTAKLEKVLRLFESADMTPDVPEDILHWLWAHNAMSTPFAIGVWKHGNLPAYLRDTALLQDCFRAMLECGEVCRRRGVDLAKNDPTGSFKLPPWLFPYVFRFLYATNESMQRFTAHAANDRHEPLGNYEAILRTGHERDVAMPHLEKLQMFADKMREAQPVPEGA